MTDIANFILAQTLLYTQREQEMNESFKKKAEEARQAYWDACKYPRKKKKAIRKEAKSNYSFYLQISEPVRYSF